LNTVDVLLQSVHDDMRRVEECLRTSIVSDTEPLGAVCGYVLDSGGKRLRPLLLLLAGRFCGGTDDRHTRLACALEYIHTATLLHDDVIDHAQIRRGNSSANVIWGNQTTILAGDFFFSRAFALAVEAGDRRTLEVIADTCSCLAEAEIAQLAKTGDPALAEEDYFTIIRNKTATLIAACARIGGMLAGVSPAQEAALAEYGMNLGIAFQIMDDVLDYYAVEKEFGKTIGKDFLEGSVTLPFIAARSRSSDRDRQAMLDTFQYREASPDALPRIIALIEKYGGDAYAFERARAYIDLALRALDVFPDAWDRRPLRDLADYVVRRTK
jgi:octaprenyl-diphosphate synthase